MNPSPYPPTESLKHHIQGPLIPTNPKPLSIAPSLPPPFITLPHHFPISSPSHYASLAVINLSTSGLFTSPSRDPSAPPLTKTPSSSSSVNVLAFTPSSPSLLPSLNGNATPPAVGLSGLETLPLNSLSSTEVGDIAGDVVPGLCGRGMKEGERRERSAGSPGWFGCCARRRRMSAAEVSSLTLAFKAFV